MRKLIILLLYIYAFSVFARPDAKEPRYFLVPKGDYSGKGRSIILKVYADPFGTRTIDEVDLKLHKNQVSMLLFYEGKTVKYSTIIASSEKKGDFYRVYYKNKYCWINKKDLANIFSYKEFIQALEGRTYFRFDSEVPLYSSIGGKMLPWVTISKYKDNKYRKYSLHVPITDSKVVDGKLWLKMEIGKSGGGGGDGALLLDEPIPVWIRAYKDDGTQNDWCYPVSIYFLESR